MSVIINTCRSVVDSQCPIYNSTPKVKYFNNPIPFQGIQYLSIILISSNVDLKRRQLNYNNPDLSFDLFCIILNNFL